MGRPVLIYLSVMCFFHCSNLGIVTGLVGRHINEIVHSKDKEQFVKHYREGKLHIT